MEYTFNVNSGLNRNSKFILHYYMQHCSIHLAYNISSLKKIRGCPRKQVLLTVLFHSCGQGDEVDCT